MLQGMAGTLTGEQRRHLGIVRDSSCHLLELINDVLDMSRIEAGQLRLEPATFDAGELVRRRTQAFETAARDRGLELQVEVEAGTGDAVGDPSRIAQIIGNLVTNALKFTESGRIVVSSRRADAMVEVAVRDTGVGIAPENLRELFAPFRQFRSPTGRLHEGTGLGLAISRNLARAMGGDVRVASVVGEGSTFTLVLPAADRVPNA
jgi:signal transduction histidine kinase